MCVCGRWQGGCVVTVAMVILQIEDVGSASQVECYLAVAEDTIVLIEEVSRDVIFTIPTKMVIGWTPQHTR